MLNLNELEAWTASYCPEVTVSKNDTELFIVGESKGSFKETIVPIGDINRIQLGCEYGNGKFLDSKNEVQFNLTEINTSRDSIRLKSITELSDATYKILNRNITTKRSPYYIELTEFESSSFPNISRVLIPCYTVLNNLWFGSSNFYKALLSGLPPENTMFNRSRSAALVNGVCSVYLNKSMANMDRFMIAYVAHYEYTYQRARDIYTSTFSSQNGQSPSLKVYPPFKKYCSLSGEGIIKGDTLWVSFFNAWEIENFIDEIFYDRPGMSGKNSEVSEQKKTVWINELCNPSDEDKGSIKNEKNLKQDLLLSPDQSKPILEIPEFKVFTPFDRVKSRQDSQNKKYKDSVKKSRKEQSKDTKGKNSKSGEKDGEAKGVNLIPISDIRDYDQIKQLKRVLNGVSEFECTSKTLDYPTHLQFSDLFYYIKSDSEDAPKWAKYSIRVKIGDNKYKFEKQFSLLYLVQVRYSDRYHYFIDFENNKSNPNPSTLYFSKNDFNQFDDDELKSILSVLKNKSSRRSWSANSKSDIDIFYNSTFRKINRYVRRGSKFDLRSDEKLRAKIEHWIMI